MTDTAPAETPLHEPCDSDEAWFACERPEAPRDSFTRYDFRCTACCIAAEAHLQTQGPRGPRPAKLAATGERVWLDEEGHTRRMAAKMRGRDFDGE